MAYTVVSGDTLGRIARANGTTVEELLRLNPDIKDANQISINQSINLPSDSATPVPSTTTNFTSGTRTATLATNEDNYQEVRQQYLDATGFEAYVGADFQLHFVVSPDSLKTLEAVGAFTLYTDDAPLPPLAGPEVQNEGRDQGVEGGVGVGEVDESPDTRGVGGTTDTTLSILTSRDMKWFFDPDTGQWMVSYKLPNSDRSVVFAATGSQLDAIFGDGLRPNSFEEISFADLTQREGVTFAGDIAEVEGTGTFEGEVDRVIALALDEGILPKWAQGSGAVLDLLFIAQSEDKSSEWLIDQLAKLPEFKTRFPGIDALTSVGLTVTEAVTGFLEMELGVKNIVLRDGGNPDSVTPDMIGGLLAQGHSLTDVAKTYATFDRLEKNQGALDAFNEVLAAQGQSPLSAEDQFEFMSGNAPAELYDIWEQASLHQAAIEAGLDIGVQGAIDLAMRTEGLTSFEAATEGLTNAAANLLRYRTEIGLERFGLNEQDLIDLSLGLAPSSGASQADIGMNMERAFQSAKATRERQRVNPFKRFSDTGVPQEASLSGIRQESS